MFLITWQYLIPLIIFAVAYWKVLGVVRRQAKVAAGRQRNRPTQASTEPVAETSMITVEPANAASTEGNIQRDKSSSPRVRKDIVTIASQFHQEVGGQNKPVNKEMSRAQINVVKTMIYVTVCFTLCWLPMYLYYLLSTFQVSNTVTLCAAFCRFTVLYCRFESLVSQVLCAMPLKCFLRFCHTHYPIYSRLFLCFFLSL